MIVIPAIDLRAGKVVRWVTGAQEMELQYGDDPLEFALRFEGDGAEWLHVIDLEGAVTGESRNLKSVVNICQKTRLKVEFGGGVRTQEAVSRILDAGIDRVILGTRGVDSSFLVEALKRAGEKIAVSLDIRGEQVRVEGWLEKTDLSLAEAVNLLTQTGVAHLVYTDIQKDGTLQGPNWDGLRDILARAPSTNVILAGGISTLNDIEKAATVCAPNFHGVIVGRALYEAKFTLREAIRAAHAHKGS